MMIFLAANVSICLNSLSTQTHIHSYNTTHAMKHDALTVVSKLVMSKQESF